ncbi:Putative methyltransferase 235L [Trachymyrmex zeteki]|uniref:Putative methyltransferase 235L n=2 Tax=Mycetomoellerius zeteki TaxID=64791 RepID=A0A151WZR9_9HYME|nr:Putative methyltransferase 235L [Trachymyrmex zeteki]
MMITINNDIIKRPYNPLMYITSNRSQREKAFAIIDEFNEYLKNISGKCIDIGCGPGDVTKDIILPALDPNAVVIGTDISESMIDYAKKRYTKEKRLEFEVLDIQTKNLPTKYVSEFDLVLSFHTLHWCNDIKQAFENIYHMLRPNGTMLVFFVVSHNIFNVLENLIYDIRFAPYIKDVNKYTWPLRNSINPRKQLKELLQTLGFTVIHCSHRDIFHQDSDLNGFFSSIIAFLDFIDHMPCDRKEEFKKEFADKFAESQIIYKQKNNQKMALDVYRVLIAFAKKHVT